MYANRNSKKRKSSNNFQTANNQQPQVIVRDAPVQHPIQPTGPTYISNYYQPPKPPVNINQPSRPSYYSTPFKTKLSFLSLVSIVFVIMIIAVIGYWLIINPQGFLEIVRNFFERINSFIH